MGVKIWNILTSEKSEYNNPKIWTLLFYHKEMRSKMHVYMEWQIM